MTKQRGHTALWIAAVNDRLANVELLIQHKASFDVGDNRDGRTALIDAVESERSETVELLLKHKAEIDLQTKVVYAWTCVGIRSLCGGFYVGRLGEGSGFEQCERFRVGRGFSDSQTHHNTRVAIASHPVDLLPPFACRPVVPLSTWQRSMNFWT